MIRLGFTDGSPDKRIANLNVERCECGHKPCGHCYNSEGDMKGVTPSAPAYEVYCRHCCDQGYQAYTAIYCTLEEAVAGWNMTAENWKE